MSWNWNSVDNGPHRDLVGKDSYVLITLINVCQKCFVYQLAVD